MTHGASKDGHQPHVRSWDSTNIGRNALPGPEVSRINLAAGAGEDPRVGNLGNAATFALGKLQAANGAQQALLDDGSHQRRLGDFGVAYFATGSDDELGHRLALQIGVARQPALVAG